MDTIIAARASCEVHVMIPFLHVAGQSATELHHWLCHVYSDNIMSNSCVREWCRKFRDGRTDVHDEVGQGWHSIVTDELIQKVDQCMRGKRCFTISELSEEFPKLWGLLCIELSRTDRVTISSVHGGYQNNWLSQNSKNVVSLDISSVQLRRGEWISWQNRVWWRDLGTVHECSNQRAVWTVDAHAFSQQAQEIQMNTVEQRNDGYGILGP